MVRVTRGLAIGLIVLFAACNATTTPKGQLLSISADGSEITLENHTDRTVYYLAVDPEFLALADFALCNDPSTCKGISPQGTARVAYRDIVGFRDGEKDVVVWQWHLEPNGDGTYRVAEFHATTIPLFPLGVR